MEQAYYGVEENVEYEDFLSWLKLASNHELYVRVKKFIQSINEISPKETSMEREVQYVVGEFKCYLQM